LASRGATTETGPWETAFLVIGFVLGLGVFFGEGYYYPPFELTDQRGSRLRRHWARIASAFLVVVLGVVSAWIYSVLTR
jgi:hypothetical protein